MSEQSLIVRDDSKNLVAFNKEADRIKEKALETSALIARVTNADENAIAVAAQIELKTVISLADKSADSLIKQANEFKNRVWATRDKFKEELMAEMTRISEFVGSFAQLEQAKARAAEQARIREEQRIEAERLAEVARLAALEAENNRKLAEQQREAEKAAQLAKSAAAKREAAELQAEVDRQRALAAAKSHEALDAVNAHFNEKAAAVPQSYEPVRAEGQRVVNDWEITVSDIHLLYRVHPNCVKLEPRISEIKNLIKMGAQVKGVIAKEIVTPGVRVGRQTAAIEV